jgi:hypothetical protein
VWFTTIIFGVVLTIQGVVGYSLAAAQSPEGFSGTKNMTGLIPAGFGVILIVAGVMARSESRRKHAMHGAVLVGLIGCILPAVMAVPKLPKLISEGHVSRADGSDATLAVVMQIVMAVICAVFVGLCVNSFVQARLLRKRAEHPEEPART